MPGKKAKTEAVEAGTVGCSVRLPYQMLAAIDELAHIERRTRGNVVRLLVEEALAGGTHRHTSPQRTIDSS